MRARTHIHLSTKHRWRNRFMFGYGAYGFSGSMSPGALAKSDSDAPPLLLGEGVGHALNLSGNGPDMIQVTGSERPIFGRMPLLPYPQVRNELVGTDSLSTQSVTVTAAERTLSFKGTGSVTLSGASTDGPLEGTGDDDIVELTFTPAAGTLTLTVAGTVEEAQLNLGDSRGDYQRVGAGQWDVEQDDVPSVPIFYLDSSDDNFAWDLPAGTYHLFVAGEKGCYFDTVAHAGGEFTAGPTTWTGGPEGAVTDLIGQRFILVPEYRKDEPFSQFEKERLVAYAKAKGCPTLYTKSANLWTGENLTVGSSWTDNGDGTYTSVNTGGGASIITQPVAEEEIPASALYIIDYTISRTFGSHRAEITRPSVRAMTQDSTASGRIYQVRAMTSPHGATPNRLVIRNASGTLNGTVSNVGFYRIDAIPLN